MGYLHYIGVRIGADDVAKKTWLLAQIAQQDHGQKPWDVHFTTTRDALIPKSRHGHTRVDHLS